MVQCTQSNTLYYEDITMTSTTMTLRLDNHLKLRLEELAELTQRTKSFLATQAIQEYIKTHEWQLNEIKKGILEADSAQLIDHHSLRKHWEKKHADADSVDEGR